MADPQEYFIKHFMEEGYTKARIDRRRIVNYKDMANVVARSDEFDFLRGEYCPSLSAQGRMMKTQLYQRQNRPEAFMPRT